MSNRLEGKVAILLARVVLALDGGMDEPQLSALWKKAQKFSQLIILSLP